MLYLWKNIPTELTFKCSFNNPQCNDLEWIWKNVDVLKVISFLWCNSYLVSPICKCGKCFLLSFIWICFFPVINSNSYCNFLLVSPCIGFPKICTCVFPLIIQFFIIFRTYLSCNLFLLTKFLYNLKAAILYCIFKDLKSRNLKNILYECTFVTILYIKNNFLLKNIEIKNLRFLKLHLNKIIAYSLKSIFHVVSLLIFGELSHLGVSLSLNNLIWTWMCDA